MYMHMICLPTPNVGNVVLVWQVISSSDDHLSFGQSGPAVGDNRDTCAVFSENSTFNLLVDSRKPEDHFVVPARCLF